MMGHDEQQARALLRTAVGDLQPSSDPYGRLMARIRRRQRARTTAISGVVVAGVTCAAILPTELARRHSGHSTIASLHNGSAAPVSPSNTRTASASSAPRPSQTSLPVDEEQVVQRFMESDPTFIQSALAGSGSGGRTYCALTIVGKSPDRKSLYVYFTCEQFVGSGGQLQLSAATSAPALFHIAGTNSHVTVLSWRLPSEGSQYAPSIREMFPGNVAALMLQQGPGVVPPESGIRARAQADLDNGTL